MKETLRRLFCGKEKWGLQKADFTESTELLYNPLRGWYSIFTFEAEKDPDFKQLEYCLDESETLALILIDIGSFQSRDLDLPSVERIKAILAFFIRNKKDIILRVTYDHEGRAMEKEPSLFSQIVRHITQVGEILKEVSGAVFIYQGLLIGNWGEMHTSRFVSCGYLKQMAAVLRENIGEGTFLAVRRPVYWRMLNEPGDLPDMGLFDDGMFGSPSNLGTFGTQTRDTVGEHSAWSREEELAFEDILCKNVPNGGEAVYGEGYSEGMSQEQLLKDLRSMHITYLNSKYDAKLLDSWKKTVYEGKGVWAGRKLYEYIGAHLGYRFWVKSVAILPVKDQCPETMCRLGIEIKNLGFASLYQEAELCLEWKDGEGNEKSKRIDFDMRKLAGGSAGQAVCTIEADEGMLFLRARLKRDERPLYFANSSGRAGRIALGCLKRQG